MDTALAILWIGSPFFLLLVTWGIGKTLERSHIRDLERREEEHNMVLLTNLKRPPDGWVPEESWISSGSVVMGTDYFKRFAAGWKSIFGGRLRSIEPVLMRARREALMRMMESAFKDGADLILNVRLETSTIGRGQNNKGFAGAEVVAYGTAVRTRG